MEHILRAIERIERYTENLDEVEFLNSELVQDPVIRNIEIVGEASNNIQRVSPAFAALHDPESRAYYDRKRSQGKKHNAALICLARRRTDVIYAMLRDGTCYQPKTPAAA